MATPEAHTGPSEHLLPSSPEGQVGKCLVDLWCSPEAKAARHYLVTHQTPPDLYFDFLLNSWPARLMVSRRGSNDRMTIFNTCLEYADQATRLEAHVPNDLSPASNLENTFVFGKTNPCYTLLPDMFEELEDKNLQQAITQTLVAIQHAEMLTPTAMLAQDHRYNRAIVYLDEAEEFYDSIFEILMSGYINLEQPRTPDEYAEGRRYDPLNGVSAAISLRPDATHAGVFMVSYDDAAIPHDIRVCVQIHQDETIAIFKLQLRQPDTPNMPYRLPPTRRRDVLRRIRRSFGIAS